MQTISSWLWPVHDLGELIAILAASSAMAPTPQADLIPSLSSRIPLSGADLSHAVESVAVALGVEAEPAEVTRGDLGAFLGQCPPAIIYRQAENGDGRFLAILSVKRGQARIVGPERTTRVIGIGDLTRLLTETDAMASEDPLERILNELGAEQRQKNRLKHILSREQTAQLPVKGVWILRLAPGSGLLAQMRQGGLTRTLGYALVLNALNYFLWIAAWGMIGRGALGGGMDPGWLMAWALILVSLVPLSMVQALAEGALGAGLGSLIKKRLLHGALAMNPDALRHAGVGQFFSTVIEAETIESLALGGGLTAVFATLELVSAYVVLGMGAGGLIHLALLTGWMAASFIFIRRFYIRRKAWTNARLELTHALVEKIGGHRTRLAQQFPENRHDDEDRELEHYANLSRKMDAVFTRINAVIPRGWLIVGLAGLLPSLTQSAYRPALTAVAVGGILMAYGALKKFLTGLTQITDALISWRHIGKFFAPPPLADGAGPLVAEPPLKSHKKGDELIKIHHLDFSFPGRALPVLSDIRITIKAGERLLLEGSSGSGKSSLAALMTGIRQPSSGLLLFKGMDPKTLGMEAWRRRIAQAPQFHENRVFTGTFLFNVLLARRWPPEPEDIKMAAAVCRELGLGELIARMPAGLLQMVGETGWQLSHGEKSRIYVARVLLQEPDCMILDESFAALDPENLALCLKAVHARADTLMVIAHP